MKNASQAPGLLRSRSLSFLFMLVTYCSLLLMPGWARGQTESDYAKGAVGSGRNSAAFVVAGYGKFEPTNDNNFATVTNASNASTSDIVTYAELSASNPMLALGGAAGEAWVQMNYQKPLDAGVTSYVRIGNLETSGFTLDLVNTLLSDVLNLLKNNIIIAEAYNGNTSINSSDVKSSIIRDGQGRLYVSVTPSSVYTGVRLKLRNATAKVLGIGNSTYKLKVYHTFNLGSADACAPAAFTELGKSTGLTVNLSDVVKNPEFAIDDNTSNYSEISTATVGLGNTVSQSIFFPVVSEANSKLKIRFGISASALNLNLIGSYKIKAFNGSNTTPVLNETLSGGLLNLDLLGLLTNGSSVTASFDVAQPFDRVEISTDGALSVNLGASLRLYSVSRNSSSCPEPPPTPNPLISPVCASASIVSSEYVDDAAFAVDGNFDSYASIRSGAGILLGLGHKSGHLEAKFDAHVPAGKTAYIRIDYDQTVLKALLAGGLGNIVTGLVNGLLLGEHYFTVEAKSSTAPANNLLGSSLDNFASTNGKIRLVQDKAGRYYIAIKSDKEYNSIRLTDHTDAVITGMLAPDQFLNVYSICYENSEEICDPAFSTSYDGSGLVALDLSDLGKNGVTNAHYAIDGNPATKSQINLGIANIGGSMEQFVNFNTLSNPQDHFNVSLSLNNGALADVSLLSNIEIKAYAGAEVVFVQKLSEDILGLDLLNLLSNGQTATLRFAPGKAFDRVSIGKSALVDVNVLSSPLYVHEVERFSAGCLDADLTWDSKTEGPFNEPACVNSLLSFENVNFPYEAITDNPDFDTYATLTAGAGVVGGLNGYSSHIELKYNDIVPANEVSYIRVEAEGDLFNALLGGSLGDALGNIVGSVALGKQNIVVQALDGTGQPIGSAYNSLAGFNSEYVKLVKDKNGKFYLAVTASEPYQAVRVEFHQNALLGLSSSSSLKVYSMCRETKADECEQAAFTSWESEGIALDLLNLTEGGVTNSEFAIDDDNSNYSTLNMGLAGIGSSISQKVYFKTKSNIEDELRVRLQLANPGVLDVDIFGNSKLIFYNGEENVKELVLTSGLINNLDLLGLLNSGGVQTLSFAPGVVYDRVELKVATLVALNTSAPIRLYGMSRISATCPDPDILLSTEIFNSPECADGVNVGTVKAVDDISNAIDGDYNTYATMRADAGVIFGINNSPSVLELNFQNPVAKGVTSYLRISDDKGVLDALLSGSLGNIVYDLVNSVVLGNNYFVVRAKNGDNQVVEGSSKDNFAAAGGLIKLVQDKAGRYFVAISPNAPYSSIEIKSFSESATGLLAKGYNLNVYGLCYETKFDDCPKAFSTSWDGAGLDLGLTGATAYGVVDAFKALDNNNNGDYSTLSTGVLSVGGAIQQNIQFPTAIPANTNLKLKMEIGTGAVNVGAFDKISIIGYKNGVKVYDEPINTAAVGVTLGDLFNNGGAQEVKMSLDTEVDEIALKLGSLVGITVSPDVRLYYLNVDCNQPTFVSWKSADKTAVTNGDEIEYTIHVRNTGSVDVNGLIIEDKIPAHTTYVENSGGELDISSNTVMFENVHIPVGEDVTRTFKVVVNNDLTNVEKIRNVALVKTNTTDKGKETFPADPTNPTEPLENGTTGTDIPVIQEKNVVSWKAYTIGADDKTSKVVSGGEEVTYHIYVRNTGNQTLSNIEISDILQPGLTWKSGGQYNNTDRKVTLTIPTLAVGETSLPQNIVVTVDKDLTGIDAITNIAVVHVDPNNPTKDVESVPPIDNTNPTEPDGTQPGTILDVEAKYTLTFSKIGKNAANTGKALPGEEIIYTLTVHNTGNKALTNIKIEDALPANTTYVSGGTLVDGTKVEFTIDELAVEGSDAVKTVTFTVKVEGALDPSVSAIENEAFARFKGENGADLSEKATHRMPLTCESVHANSFTVDQNNKLCEGETITLTADVSALKPGTVVRWYADADLNNFIKVGLTLDVNPALGAKYYAIIEHDDYCFGGAPLEYVVKFLPTATADDITVTGMSAAICEGSEVTLVASSTTVQNPVFKWYSDAALTQELPVDPIATDGSVLKIMPYQSGSVFVTVSGTTHCVSTPATAKEIEFTVTEAPKLEVDGDLIIYVAPKATITWPTITSPDGLDIKWYNDAGVDVTSSLPVSFDEVGVYTFTALVNKGNCIAAETIVVNVYDGTGCPPGYVREYAIKQSWGTAITGGISNRAGAIDRNVKTYSTLTTGLGLLGIGTVWQNLYFDEIQPAGTPVTLKLGKEYSGVSVAGAISVVGLDKEVGDYQLGGAVGPIRPVAGGLLDLLSSDNIVEYTFVPTNGAGIPVAYKGVRIVQGALLSLAQNARVYGAYLTKEGKPSCDPIDDETNKSVIDVLHGVMPFAGLGVADALSTVKDPWRAVDNNPDSFAEIWNGLGVLNKSFIKPVFKSRTMPTDSLQIITEVPGQPVLALELLNDYQIQRYLGDSKVGAPIRPHSNNILNLRLLGLLGSGQKKVALRLSDGEVYDRVEISYLHTVSLLGDFVKIYDIDILPKIERETGNGQNFEICAGDNLVIKKQDACTQYLVYDEAGNLLTASDGYTFTIPGNTEAGEHIYYVQAIREGCEVGPRQEIMVYVNPVPTIKEITLNGSVLPNNEITLAPGETLDVKVAVETNGAELSRRTWQMKNANNKWVVVSVPGFSQEGNNVTMPIPGNGLFDGVDYRGRTLEFRMLFETDNECKTISEIVTLHISDSKFDFGGDNIIKEATAGANATAIAGNEFSYIVTVKNGGPSTIVAGDVLYLQDLPSDGQTVKIITAGPEKDIALVGDVDLITGGFKVRALRDIPKDGTFNFEVVVNVDAAITAKKVHNIVKIWIKDPSANNYVNPEDGKATSPQYEVIRDYGFDDDAITKVGQNSNENAVAGKPYSYTVTVTNNGPSTILKDTPVYFQDVTSDGQQLVDVTYNGAPVAVGTGGLFSVALDNAVAAGASFNMQINVLVDANAVGPIDNTIHIWQNNPGTDISTLPTPEGTAKTPPIDVDRDYGWGEPGAVLKEGGVTAVAGEAFTYTVTLTNKGTSTILDGTELRLQDVVSAGQTITEITSDKGTVSPVNADGFFTLSVNQDVAVTEQIKLTVVVDIDPDAQVNTVQNTINIWEDKTPITDVPDGTDTTDPIPVTFNAKFTVTKTTDATEAVAGEKVKYDVVLTNSGPSTAKVGKEILVIEKPGNMVITTADIKVMSGNAELDGSYDASTGEFTLKVTKDVKLTEQIVLEIYAMVPANATGTVKNGVKVDDDEEETPEIPVVDKVKFAVEKTVAAGQNAVAGEQIDFDVVLTNNGPSTAKPGHKVLVIEKPGPFLTITAADIKVTSGNANLFEGKYNEATGEFTLVVTNEVDLGATISLTVTAHIAEEATGTIKNGIKVEDEETETPPIPVDNKAKFGVKKTANKTEVFAGDVVDFKVVLTNNGPSTAQVGHEIKVIETPDGMTITAADIVVVGDNASFDGNYNQSTGEFTVKVTKPVAVGGTVELNIKGHVPLDATGTVKNGIEVDDDTDVTPEIPVVDESKLKIVKVADENKVKAGEMTTFTLTITNQGPAAVQSGKTIVLEERPGVGLSIKDYEMISTNATVQGSDNKATLTTTQAIGIGEEIKVKVHVLVSEDAPEEVTNGISVWGPGKDPGTDPEDDKDDTEPTPVEHERIQAVDDEDETKTGIPVTIDVLANDIVTKWDIDRSSVEIVDASEGAIITVGADGKVTYESSRDKIGEDTFTYRVKDIKGRWSNTATVRVNVMSNTLDIPNIITPNGDGKNDEFRIKGLELYDKVGLTIVNRWGNEVYRSNAYNNDWSGIGLSEGTYFYILELLKGGKLEVHKGWVTIKSN